MNTDRIKEIQSKTAYPESQSVQQALMQVWNECDQERKTFATSEDRTAKLERLAALLGVAWFYGDFKAETVNEREQESLMKDLGYVFYSEDEAIAAIRQFEENWDRFVSDCEC